ncbi:3-oxoacyl-ACP synthase [Nannocystis punicea]|uniref:3-oxoacyl-ACP synthase n=1 Tax=Nannocystis punicea TaxID=2995304 RepID=A0ABY7HFH6_9BACT|nr:3-oxoacyl-ACP synthase [Nannocystis poenicansa]WAS98036.1 3-oxoacyl-ACP synthase [Nannocystis poenicansa]
MGVGLAVLRVGLGTPLGLSAATTLAAVRAGVVRFAETKHCDRRGEPLRASRLSRLDPSCERSGRIAALAGWAARDCLAGFESASPLPLYFAAPARSGAPVDEAAIVAALQAEVAAPLELGEVVRGGRAGMFQLLDRLARPDAPPLALVLAADSLCDPSTLRRLGRRDRVLGAQRDGIIPGEAAAALLLARGPGEQAREGPPAARVRACSLGQVTGGRGRVQALADGLTDVFGRLAREPAARGSRPRCVASCQTGEVVEARAFSYAALRQAPLMPEPLVHLRACESFGDTGAAAPALVLALALHRLRGRAGRALLYGSADDGALGACVLEVAGSRAGAGR